MGAQPWNAPERQGAFTLPPATAGFATIAGNWDDIFSAAKAIFRVAAAWPEWAVFAVAKLYVKPDTQPKTNELPLWVCGARKVQD